MRKILVTGGAGYIGSHTVVELVNAGFDPVIIDNFSNSEPRIIDGIEKITGRKVNFHEGDCNNLQFVKEVLIKEGNVSGVIHFAAYKAVGESVAQPLKYYQNNIGSLLTILESMKQHQVSNIVFSSSCTVYGEPEVLPVNEDSPFQIPESPYGNTKQICEEIIRDIALGKDTKINSVALRYFNPIGAHPSANIGELPLGTPNNLVPFVTQTAAGLRDELTVFGGDYDTEDGTCIRDYIHVVDLAKAHVKAIKYLFGCDQHNSYETFNIGTGSGSSVLEIINAFEEVSGIKLKYKIGERRDGDVMEVYGDVSKASSMMNWEASLTVTEALSDAWRWQKKLK